MQNSVTLPTGRVVQFDTPHHAALYESRLATSNTLQLLAAHGFVSLREVSGIANRPASTLQDWVEKNPRLLHVVIKGAARVRDEQA